MKETLMRIMVIAAAFSLTACLPLSPAPAQPPAAVEPADLVLTRGVIYTVDKSRSIAEALAVRGNTIVYVGDDAGAQAFIGPQTQVIDLQGQFVMPGLIDSHAHAASGVSAIYEVTLYGGSKVEDYQQAITAFLAKTDGLGGLQGVGWSNPVFEANGPTAAMLDAVVADIPAVLYSQDYHSAWLNSKALELAGITRDTPDPAGGLIERAADGSPLGTLRESAVNLAAGVIPPYTTAQHLEGLAYFQNMAHAYGMTTVYIPSLPGNIETGMQALHDFEASGKLAMRFPTAVKVDPGADLSVVNDLLARRSAEAGGYYEIVAAKLFMDGVLESGTAYLEQPYLQQPGRGEPLWEPQAFNAMCAALDQAGLQIHVHAIGDAAVRETLDGFAYARQQNGARDSRHIITHLQFVRPEDITRMAELGVVAVAQPYWFMINSYYDQAVAFVGQERADAQYPLNAFFKAGIKAASSSDYPVTSPPNPLSAIQTGVLRTVPEGLAFVVNPDYENPLNPPERVTVAQMIESFTINGAYALFKEDQLGSLEVGKLADFIVLNQNILKIDPAEIHNTLVLRTFFDGREVYRRPE